MDFRFELDRVKDAPLGIERELPTVYMDGILQAEPATGFVAVEPAAFRGKLSRVNAKDIVFEAEFSTALRTSCKRCLTSVDVGVPVKFLLELVPRSTYEAQFGEPVEDDGQGEIAGTFTPEEAAQVPYDGNVVDLAPVVREQILLALPMGVVCSEGCQGLCQVCGKNLNEGDCACDRHVPDPRWAALKSIKLES